MESNNFGTGGYGMGNAKGAAGLARMQASTNPYFAVASFLVNRAAQNIGGSIDDSHRINQEVNTKGKGDVNAEHSSPFGAMDAIGSQMIPGAEKLLSANTKPLEVAPGSSDMQPAQVDSSQQPFSTKMQDYLNYMKYRG